MESINERIAFVVKAKTEGNATRFAELLGVTPQYINKIIKEGGSVGIEPITKILKIFPDLEARWFILGEGDPFKTPDIEYEVRNKIKSRVEKLLSFERYIPAMTKEDLEVLAESLQRGEDPEFDPYKFQVWDTIVSTNKKAIETRVSEAMDKGICKTKKVSQ